MVRFVFLAVIALASFTRLGFAMTISSANYSAVPVGEKITLTGSGFTNTSAVTFFWNRLVNSAVFNVVSDTVLEVTFPTVTQNIRDRYILVESPTGSALTMAGSVLEFEGRGAVPNTPPFPTQILAKAGSVLEEYPTSGLSVVYVQSGAVLQYAPATAGSLVIFAESGAVLDFRGTTFSASSPPLVIYSSGTTVLGSLPTGVVGIGGSSVPRQITPLSLNRNVGPFTLGVRVNRTVIGGGATSIEPSLPFIRHSSSFTITATPDPGWMFQGWTGSVTGSNPVVTAMSGSFDMNVTATFTEGYTLETFPGSWGSISGDPAAATYAPGQSVQLTAVPQPGFQFVKWGGDLSGEPANPATLVMDSDKAVSAVFEPLAPPASLEVSTVDHPAVPVGEAMTLTGNGLANTSAVTYYWLPFIQPASFTAVSDSELRVTYPQLTQNIRDYFLLIESPNGSTITLNGSVHEFTGMGAPPVEPYESIVVKAGAVMRGLNFSSRVVYLESGAVLQNVPASGSSSVIFAEDGATLDLRGTTFSSSSPPLIIYSPGTTILGSLPGSTGGVLGQRFVPRQVPSLSLSRGVGPFTLGVRLNLSVVGSGSAISDPPGPFVRHSTEITLTATPESSSVFGGWSGAVSSPDPVTSFNSGISDRNVVATFTAGYSLESYPSGRGTISADPPQTNYSAGQEIQLSAEPLQGYRFVKWGGDFEGETLSPLPVSMSSNKLVSAVFEPIAAVPETRITAVDHPSVPIGAKMNFSGTGFTGTSAVSFFWTPFVNSASFEVVSDSALQVTFPNVTQPVRDRFVLVESPNGSTVTMAGVISEISGVTSLSSLPGITQSIIKSGAIASGLSSGARVMYLEAGAVLRNVSGSSSSCVIIAADGATLDLRGVTYSSSFRPLILHGPGTLVLGTLPPASTGGPSISSAASRQIPSPSLSRDIGPFNEGFQLTVNSEGPGAVNVDPIMAFYPRGTSITLTATPNPGNHFIRWAGGVGGTSNPLNFQISGTVPITARFSDRQDFFSGWRQRYFSPEELANPAISGLDADPDRDQITNSGEYAFGTDPTQANSGSGLRIVPGNNPLEEGGLRLVYSRPSLAADISYVLRARQALGDWFDGSAGDILFDVVEESTVSQDDDSEEVTLFLKFTGEIPGSLFFQLSANIEDLP